MFGTSTGKYVARAGVALALTLGVMATGVSVAGASDHHHSSWSHDSGASSSVAGTVTAASLTGITVMDRSGTSTVYTIDSTTVITEGSATVTAAALRVGEHVRVTPATAGLAATIKIRLSQVKGKVTAVSVSGTTSTFTVVGREGLSFSVVASSATTYTKGGAAATVADVIVGSEICASGVVNTTANALDAVTIKIASTVHQAWVFGKVTAFSGMDLTVSLHNGLSVSVVTTSTTTFTKGGAAATFADASVGTYVLARGTVDTTTNALDATAVSILTVDTDGDHDGGTSTAGIGANLFGNGQSVSFGGRNGGHHHGGGRGNGGGGNH